MKRGRLLLLMLVVILLLGCVPLIRESPPSQTTSVTSLPSEQPVVVENPDNSVSDPSPTAGPQYLSENTVTFEVFAQVGGYSKAIAMGKGNLVVGIGPRIVILDASDPSQMEIIGQSQVLKDMVQALLVRDNVSYVAVDNSLLIFDIADQQKVQVVGQLELPHAITHLSLRGTTLYIGMSEKNPDGSGSGMLASVDVSNPLNPTALDYLELPIYVAGMATSEEFSYVGNPDQATVYAVNISNPLDLGEPIPINSIGPAYSMLTRDGMLYIGTAFEISGWEMADLLHPRHRWTLDITDGVSGVVKDFEFVNGRVLLHSVYGDVGVYSSSIIALDYPHSAEPLEIATLESGTLSLSEDNSSVFASDGQVAAFDLDNLEHPVGIFQPSISTLSSFDTYEEWVLALDRDNFTGLSTLSILDDTLQVVGQYIDSPQCSNCRSALTHLQTGEGSLAFISAWEDGIRVVDFTDPASPALIRSSFNSENPITGPWIIGDMVLNDSYLYAGAILFGRDPQLYVFNVSDPTLFEIGSSVSLEGYESQIALIDSLLFVGTEFADRDGGRLYVMDISNPLQPKETYSIDFSEKIIDVQASDTTLVVGTTTNVYIFSIVNEENITSTADLSFSQTTDSMVLYKEFLLITTSHNLEGSELLAVDLSDPSKPVISGDFELPSGRNQISLLDDRIVVGGEQIGLMVLELVAHVEQ